MIHIKIFISLLLTLELFGLHSPVLAQMDSNKKQVIVIDPGHGGKDSGAIGLNGILEKDIVLSIAKQMVDINEADFKNQFEIYLTRYKDTLISLRDRTKLARTLKADLFLSLHCNHSDNPNARGLEVYASKKQGKYSKESVLLAYKLQIGLRKNLGFESRGVKFANFQVLRDTEEYFPSVLLELGFLSNWDEGSYIKKRENQKKISLLILNHLKNYK